MPAKLRKINHLCITFAENIAKRSRLTVKKDMADFHNRLSDDTDYKRSELIRKIERAVERMSLSELEALSYDMFTKGYLEDC